MPGRAISIFLQNQLWKKNVYSKNFKTKKVRTVLSGTTETILWVTSTGILVLIQSGSGGGNSRIFLYLPNSGILPLHPDSEILCLFPFSRNVVPSMHLDSWFSKSAPARELYTTVSGVPLRVGSKTWHQPRSRNFSGRNWRDNRAARIPERSSSEDSSENWHCTNSVFDFRISYSTCWLYFFTFRKRQSWIIYTNFGWTAIYFKKSEESSRIRKLLKEM